MPRRHPHRTAPPIDHGDARIDAEVALRELDAELGLLVWKTVRTVRLWAELPPRERGRAFSDGAHAERLERIAGLADGAPRHELERAAAVLRGSRVDAEEVSEACRELAAWAEERGATGTALELMQAAAFTAPEDAAAARDAGRLAALREEGARAESWYRHAVGIARRTRDNANFARSFLGLGELFVARGSSAAAGKAFTRALRIARRHSQHEVTGDSYRHLAKLAGRGGEVARLTEAALEAYRPGHPALPALAADFAAYLAGRGLAEPARRLVEGIPAGAAATAARDEVERRLAEGERAGEARVPRRVVELVDDLAAALEAASPRRGSTSRGAR